MNQREAATTHFHAAIWHYLSLPLTARGFEVIPKVRVVERDLAWFGRMGGAAAWFYSLISTCLLDGWQGRDDGKRIASQTLREDIS